MLNSLVATNGNTIRDMENIGGVAMKRDGQTVPSKKATCIYAPLSDHFTNALFGFDGDSIHVDVGPGEVVGLVGQVALPCVCEVPPSCAPLFSAAGAKVVSQGITWQSLYLVLLGRHFVLVEPDRHSTGSGRVVTRCRLERISLEKDSANARADTSARRLVVTYEGPDATPPGLFLFDESPKAEDEGSLLKLKQWRSTLDVWFEDYKSVTLAFNKVQESITAAKIYRGHRIQHFLSQEEGSGYPRNMSLYEASESD